jgi:hypothetical protein
MGDFEKQEGEDHWNSFKGIELRFVEKRRL